MTCALCAVESLDGAGALAVADTEVIAAARATARLSSHTRGR
jgi:hypothetical protein